MSVKHNSHYLIVLNVFVKSMPRIFPSTIVVNKNVNVQLSRLRLKNHTICFKQSYLSRFTLIITGFFFCPFRAKLRATQNSEFSKLSNFFGETEGLFLYYTQLKFCNKSNLSRNNANNKSNATAL